ncbi:N-carbamoylputrescine amidase [Facilibium subflavum]|nr:N-carbamoylputrescine amidase [Facilibium subflavum]
MKIKTAVIQLSFSDDISHNITQLVQKVTEASKQNANIILIPELPSYLYFCKLQSAEYFKLAEHIDDCRLIREMQLVARQYKVVIPVSFFEKVENTFFNSVAMIDADGQVLGVYRKSHIPDGTGYQEKYYFSPGKSGFKVWQTQYGRIGCGICWDQWFPEAARVMTLKGADILLYPTAIGSEPHLPEYDSKAHWQTVMQGHSAANMIPVLAANRYGIEKDHDIEINFYGSSFITDHKGQKIAEADRISEQILYADFNLDHIKDERISWGIFRDRRPDLYLSIAKEV